MKEPVSLPPEVVSLLPEIHAAIDSCLNGSELPRKYGFVLMVVPANRPPPVQIEIRTNLVIETLPAVFAEALARIQGRVVDHAGEA